VIVLAIADAELAAALAALPAAEQELVARVPEGRRRELIAGRTALHVALGASVAILADDRGAPIAPAGWAVSVTHKAQRGEVLAAALVAPGGDARIGLDLEAAVGPRLDIGKRILTAREQAALPDRERAVTLRFAIKEAIYKAVDPFVRRYVGFTEVELDVGDDGTCAVASELGLAIEATWREHAGHWLATARARYF
jgi:enterobactin synthetase component D